MQCNKVYTRKSSLNNHMKYDCGKLPQFLCPHCPFATKRKGNFKTHVLLKHSLMISRLKKDAEAEVIRK